MPTHIDTSAMDFNSRLLVDGKYIEVPTGLPWEFWLNAGIEPHLLMYTQDGIICGFPLQIYCKFKDSNEGWLRLQAFAQTEKHPELYACAVPMYVVQPDVGKVIYTGRIAPSSIHWSEVTTVDMVELHLRHEPFESSRFKPTHTFNPKAVTTVKMVTLFDVLPLAKDHSVQLTDGRTAKLVNPDEGLYERTLLIGDEQVGFRQNYRDSIDILPIPLAFGDLYLEHIEGAKPRIWAGVEPVG